jgi:hypothetical protein
MGGALFNRITTWGFQQTLTSAALNAEFNNILNFFNSQYMDGYSDTVAQMQIQTSPGGVGTESLATSVAAELARLRFVIAEITGQTFWYQAPVTSLSQLNSALGAASLQNKVASGQTNGTAGSSQPDYLVPAGTSTTITVNAASTPLVYSIAGASYSIAANTAVTSLTVATNANNTAIVNDTSMSAQPWTKIAGEFGSVITLATVGSAIANLAGQICAYKNQTSGEYFMGRLIQPVINGATVNQITECRRGFFYNSSSAPVVRAGITSGDTIQLMKLTWIFATTASGLALTYDNPTFGGVAPTSPNTGDYWFDMTVNYWKIYSGTQFIAANATLIGYCIQDTSHCVGARSLDFFEGYSTLNSVELTIDQTSNQLIRSRYIGCGLNVYGSILRFDEGYLNWQAGTSNVSGVTVTSGNFYYFYIDLIGQQWIDSIAPYDRRGDLQGFYHPYQTWRCVGYAYASGSNSFASVESFYRNDTSGVVQATTTASTGSPLPDLIRTSPWFFPIDTSGGSFTQILPPVAACKGQTITYFKISSDYNICTLKVFEPAILTTTGSWSNLTATNLITSLASTAGLTSGLLVSGTGIPRGTTVTASTATTATLSQPVFSLQTSTAVTFGQTGGINNNQTVTLATNGELISFFSTGLQWVIREHTYPQDWINFPAAAMASGVLVTATSSPPTFGTLIENTARWRRIGDSMHLRWSYSQSAAGSAGSGTYIFNLFSGAPAINTALTGSTQTPASPQSSVGRFGGEYPTSSPYMLNGEVMVYSSTQLFNNIQENGGGDNAWSSGSTINFATSTTGVSIFVTIDAMIPMLGWTG